MTHDELIKTPEYWTTMIQFELFEKVEQFLEDNNMTRKQFADMLGVSKGYVTQVLNGDYDHRISKLVELSLSIGYYPQFSMKVIEESQKSQENIQRVMDKIHSLSKSIDRNAFLFKLNENKDKNFIVEYNKLCNKRKIG